MTVETPLRVIKQHLIDPEICIRCNTCEETCPIDAITHDSNNYVVDVDICNSCMACVPPCPTGAIDNWLKVVATEAYSLEDQFSWQALPAEQELPADSVEAPVAEAQPNGEAVAAEDVSSDLEGVPSTAAGASIPPWSAAHPYINLYTHKNIAEATIAGNYRLTDEVTD